MILVEILTVAALVALSGVVALARLSALGISDSRLRTLREEGFRRAQTLTSVQERVHAVSLGARLLSDTLALAAVGVAALSQGASFGEGTGWVDVLLAGTAAVLARSLFAPLLAARNPVRVGLAMAPLLLFLSRLISPPARVLSRLFPTASKNGGDEIRAGERELIDLRELGREEGVIEEAESRLVERAFRLDELDARDVMVPRVDIFAWPASLTTGEVHRELEDVPYSRIPVYGDSIDDVTGVVHVRDIYRQLAGGRTDMRLGELARRPMFVPPSRSCAELVADFRTRRVHLGIVADEFGGTDGLVTLEDVIEELVGEIQDETDVEPEEIVRAGDAELLCGGGVDLREIAEALKVTFPKGEHRSLNGLILDERGRIPESGEHLKIGEVGIEITGRTDSRVTRAKVTRLASRGDAGA